MTPSLHHRFINLGHFAVHYMLLIFPTAAIAIEREWQSSYGAVLQLGTAGLIAFALATLPAGWLGDRIPRTALMLAFFLGGGMSCALAALATGPISLALSLVGIGIFAAIYHPVGLAILSDLSARQGRAFAVNGVFGNLGLAGAALGTGYLSDLYGWRAAFLIPGILIFIVGCAYALALQRQGKSGHSQDNGDDRFVKLPNALQFRVILLVAAAALFGGLIFNGVTVTLPKVFDERLASSGLSLSMVGSASALVFAVAAFAQLPVGEALDRAGARPVLLVLLSVQMMAMLLLASASGFYVLALALVLVVAIFAEIPVTSWLLARFVAPAWRARAYSLEYVFSLGVSSMIIPLIAYLHEGGGGFHAMFLVLAGAAAIVLLVAMSLPSRATLTRAEAHPAF